MPEYVLPCDVLRPKVFVTAKCTYLMLVHDGGIEWEIVRVVLAKDDGTPSNTDVSVVAFVRDLGIAATERLMHRFHDEAFRQMRAPAWPAVPIEPAVSGGAPFLAIDDIEYHREKLIAALGLAGVPREYIDPPAGRR